jgi:hypothetical protein
MQRRWCSSEQMMMFIAYVARRAICSSQVLRVSCTRALGVAFGAFRRWLAAHSWFVIGLA